MSDPGQLGAAPDRSTLRSRAAGERPKSLTGLRRLEDRRLSTQARRDEFIDTGEVRIRVRVSGTGPPMMFPSAGWGPSVDLYFETMPLLAERFTVAWIDTRGTGQSDRPANGDYSFASFVRDFDAVRNRLDWDTCWIAGHSMGGFLAQLYAATYARRCSGLLAICTYPAMDEDFQTERQARILQRSHEPWFQDAVAAFDRNVSTDEELAAQLEAMLPMYFADQEALTQNRTHFERTSFSVDAFEGAFGSNPDHEVLTRLGDVDAPSIIVVADRDFICSPPLGQRIHLALPGSKLVLVEDSGHFPWIEQPKSFWRSVDAALATCGFD